MKVTNIKQQIKRTDRYSVFLDGKYSFSLSEAELIDLNLRVDQVIEDSDLARLNNEAEYSNAKNSCYRLLSYRARSTGEIEEYLKRKNYNADIIERVTDYLTSKAFINDELFAKQWVENRVKIKKASIKQIKSELRQKKVSVDIINKVLDSESISEVEVIKELVDKKRNQLKYRDDLKLMQFLARRGFSYNKILIALGRRAE
jgi:regulatory protein